MKYHSFLFLLLSLFVIKSTSYAQSKYKEYKRTFDFHQRPTREIIITEIYYDSHYEESEDKVNNHLGEFIELYNPNDFVVNLNDFAILDFQKGEEKHNDIIFSNDVEIQPKDFILIAYGPSKVEFINLFPSLRGKENQIVMHQDFWLHNLGEIVSIYSDSDASKLLDYIAYGGIIINGDKWGGTSKNGSGGNFRGSIYDNYTSSLQLYGCQGQDSRNNPKNYRTSRATPLAFPNDVSIEDIQSCRLISLMSNETSPHYHHYLHTLNYNIADQLESASISYYDNLGKNLQSQSIDRENQITFASQSLNDEHGRPVISIPTFPTASNDLKYKGVLVVNQYNNPYPIDQKEELQIVGTKVGTIGSYYSENNTLNPRQSITKYPVLKTIYDQHRPGEVKKVLGGDKLDTNSDGVPDSWPNGFSHSMPVGQELYYAFGKNYFPKNHPIYPDYKSFSITESTYNTIIQTKDVASLKATKSVSRTIEGVEMVSFTDSDGKVLATARSGKKDNGTNGAVQTNISLVGPLGFVDIHIPDVAGQSISKLDASGAKVKLIDLVSGKQLYSGYFSSMGTSLLKPGFYRLVETTENYKNIPLPLTYFTSTNDVNRVFQKNIGLKYKTNYYDFSLNYYDKTGRLTASVPPLGWQSSTTLQNSLNHNLKVTNSYNSINELQKSTSPDGGEGRFIYRKDGQIRFSQNIYQKSTNNGLGQSKTPSFSYTHYDDLNRVLEVGVYQASNANSLFDELYRVPNDSRIQTSGTTLFTQSSCKDQTHFFFDYPDDPRNNKRQPESQQLYQILLTHSTIPPANYVQKYTVGGLSKIWTGPNNNMKAASWYSYDEYNRLSWVVQYIKGFDGKGLVTTIDYVYDVLGNVTHVIYQKDTPKERYEHYYGYDDLHRLKNVFTRHDARDQFIKHAEYKYALTGEVMRIELGKENNILQGIDFTYGSAGLKFINDPSGDPNKDPGKDGTTSSNVPRDVFSFAIDRYNGDYNRPSAGLSVNNKMHSILGDIQNFDGNIGAVRWITQYGQSNPSTDMYVYKYNKNGWLKEARFGRFDNNQSFTASNDYNVYGLDYDANGNIKTLNRKATGGKIIDQLTYNYYPGTNQLSSIRDQAQYDNSVGDITNQNSNNYIYNSIGQLVKDGSANIKIEYNAYGLVDRILNSQNGVTLAEYLYDANGKRVGKSAQGVFTYYMRDLSGSVMAIYNNNTAGNTLQLAEIPIYGSGRLGMDFFNEDGNHQALYELTDHLGNVRAVIGYDMTGSKPIVINSWQDYYPFGWKLPGRNQQGAEGYRYGYQGQFAEEDVETGWNSFELRMWDGRIGRWMTTDPAGQYHSPYLGMGNNPLNGMDPDGGWFDPPAKDAAFMADFIYYANIGDSFDGVNGNPWELINLYTAEGINGLRSGLFFDGNEYVFAFAGTDPFSGADWGANTNNFLFNFNKSGQYSDGIFNAYLDLMNARNEGREFTLVGHSLGGSIASAGSLLFDVNAITFNASGVSTNPKNYFNFSSVRGFEYSTEKDVIAVAEARIDAFIIEGEIVNETVGFFKPAIGNRIILSKPFNDVLFQDVKLHLMGAVIDALQMQENQNLIPNYLK